MSITQTSTTQFVQAQAKIFLLHLICSTRSTHSLSLCFLKASDSVRSVFGALKSVLTFVKGIFELLKRFRERKRRFIFLHQFIQVYP